MTNYVNRSKETNIMTTENQASPMDKAFSPSIKAWSMESRKNVRILQVLAIQDRFR